MYKKYTIPYKKCTDDGFQWIKRLIEKWLNRDSEKHELKEKIPPLFLNNIQLEPVEQERPYLSFSVFC